MPVNFAAVWSRTKRLCFNLASYKRLLMVLCTLGLIVTVYISLNAFVSTRLMVAQRVFDRAYQLNLQLFLNTSSSPDTKLIEDVLTQAVHKDRTLVDIRILERSWQSQWQCGDAKSQLNGPVEPLLRWLMSLEARGISLMSLRWSRSTEGTLDVCL